MILEVLLWLTLPLLARSPSSPPPATYDREMARFLPAPHDQATAEKLVQAYFRDNLRDPDSARYRFVPVVHTLLQGVGSWPQPAVILCGDINSRNQFGGYTGRRAFMAVFDPATGARLQRVFADEEGENATASRCTSAGDAKVLPIPSMAELPQELARSLQQQIGEYASRLAAMEQRRLILAAQVTLLDQQAEELRGQFARVAAALDVAERSERDKNAQIANLGSRLNAALAGMVEERQRLRSDGELQRYRGELYGRLREVIGNRPGVQVIGARFVFQSEVLFAPGDIEMTPAGIEQVRAVAAALKEVSRDIPRDQPWILRVDGHADRQPPRRGQFANNWEFSARRAVNVVTLLVAEGIPANRLAATGFGEFQPLDPSDGPAGYARNRRIELRLMDQ